MASLTHTPFADTDPPAVPYNDSAFTGGNGNVYGVVTGLFPYTEGGGRGSTSWGATTRRGRHCVMCFDVEDSSGTTAHGTWMELFTVGDSDLSANAFHASGQKLQEPTGLGHELGTANQGLPDGVWAKGTLFHADGKANALHPGIRDPEHVFLDDGGAFTDVTTNATDSDVLHDVDLTALGAINDAIYIRSAQPFLQVIVSLLATGSTGTYTLEYSQGSASWGTLTVTDTGILGAAAHDTVKALFITDPGDWATDTVNGQTGYWLRLRWTATATVAAKWSRVWIGRQTTYTHLAPAAYYVTDDPGTNTPDVIPWGIDCWWPIAADLKGGTGTWTWNATSGLQAAQNAFSKYRVVYYDSVRDIESPWFENDLIGATGLSNYEFRYVATLQANVNAIRVYLYHTVNKRWYRAWITTDSTGGTQQIQTTEASPSQGAKVYVVGCSSVTDLMVDQAAGPHHATDGNMTNVGGPVSVAYLRNRVYAAGGRVVDDQEEVDFANIVRPSAAGKPHQFPSSLAFEVAPNDGDEIVCVRALRDVLLIFKRNSIHLSVGEPGAGNRQTKRGPGSIGCIAAQTAVVVGNVCYFLSREGVMQVDATGKTSAIPESEDLAPIFAALDADTLHTACATYDPTDKLYLLALPGLQAQFSGGAAPTEAINDGLCVLHIPTGQWALYGGVYAASLATVPKDSNTTEVWVGDYWGRAWRFTDDTTEGQVVSDVAVTYGPRTATGGTSTTLTDTGATFLPSATDHRLLGMWVWIISGTGAGQRRKIIGSTNTALTVSGAWTTTPDSTSQYVIGHYYAAAEFGDWDFGVPDKDKDLERLIVYLENAFVTNNTLDAAVAALDFDDSNAAFEYAGAGADSTKKPITISLPPVSGLTQRLRVHMRVSAGRPKIRAMTVVGNLRGRAYG